MTDSAQSSEILTSSPLLGFPKSSRLLNSSDYASVFNRTDGKVSHQRFLILARHNPGSPARLGLVVAKKNIRNASQRNFVKRIVRESFRHWQQELTEMDIVFLARRGLADSDRSKLREMIDSSWPKLLRKVRRPSL